MGEPSQHNNIRPPFMASRTAPACFLCSLLFVADKPVSCAAVAVSDVLRGRRAKESGFDEVV